MLVREFRPGVEEALLELPGGGIDGAEAPIEAARRELLEETGYAGELEPAGTMVDCAYFTRIRHVFVGRNCRRVTDPATDPGRVARGDADGARDVRARLRSGRLTDVGPGYLALDMLGALERVR